MTARSRLSKPLCPSRARRRVPWANIVTGTGADDQKRHSPPLMIRKPALPASQGFGKVCV